jgi:hypothetical protein
MILILLLGCTEQMRVKTWGGESSINLPCGTKLVNATWKNADIWYLTRPMHDGELVETYSFAESSSWGLMEGVITVKECRE